MRQLALVTLPFVTLALAASGAEDPDGRYRVTPTSDGFLKLDSRTGAISECKSGAAGFQCRLVPDDQTVLQQEIDRLATENAELKRRLGDGRAGPEKPGTGGSPAPGSLPPTDEVERGLGIVEKFVRRMMRIMREEAEKPI
jgi:hypothetical protein